jgi:hypothetical protein
MPLRLFAELLHAFGWSLWTGLVAAVFTQVVPEAKRRQIKQTLDAYQVLRHEKSQVGNNNQGAGPKEM